MPPLTILAIVEASRGKYPPLLRCSGKDNFHFPANTLNTRPGTTLCVRHRCKDTVVHNKRPLIRDKQIKSTHEPVRLKGPLRYGRTGASNKRQMPVLGPFCPRLCPSRGFFPPSYQHAVAGWWWFDRRPLRVACLSVRLSFWFSECSLV